MLQKPTLDVERKKNTKQEIIILVIFTMIFLLINAVRLYNDSISGDEGYSIMLAQENVSQMIQDTAGDVHPPLYYLIFQAFALFIGTSAVAAKVVTFVAILLTMILANTYIRREFGGYAAAFFVILLTFNETGLSMIVEARMYTWAMLFVTLTGIFAYELLKQQKFYKWAGLLIFGLAAGYTHYYALIMVFFLYSSLFIILMVRDRKNLLPCMLCGIAAVIGYLPWLFVLLQQFGMVSEDYWIGSIEIKEWIRYIFGHDRFGRLLRVILYISGFLYLFTKEGLEITHNLKCKGSKIGQKRNNSDENHVKDKELTSTVKDAKQHMDFAWEKVPKDQWNKRWLVVMSGVTVVGTLAVATIVSYVFRPLYVERYMYSAFGLIALTFGITFTGVSRKKLYSWILIAMIILVGTTSYHHLYQLEAGYGNQTEEAKAFFQDNLQPGDVFVTDNRQLSWTVLRYYYPEVRNEYVTLYDAYTEDYHTIWYFAEKPEPHERVLEYEANGLKVTHVEDGGIGRYPYYLYQITKE